jgi:hypothetical protein
LAELDAEWDAERWAAAAEPYFDEYEYINAGSDARGPSLFLVTEEPERWLIQQIIDDPQHNNDWRLSAELDLAATDAEGTPVLGITSLQPL